MEKEISIQQIRDVFNELFYNKIIPECRVKMFTNAAGMDKFTESFEENAGLTRIYIGNKVPRILRRMKYNILRSYTKGYYRLVKI